MSMLTEIARNCTTGSKFTEGLTKISTADIIARYPNGITITEYAIMQGQGQDGPYAAFKFSEDNSVFFYGGSILKDIADAWTDGCQGNVEQANQLLKTEGGVKVRLHRKRSKAGREYTAVTIL